MTASTNDAGRQPPWVCVAPRTCVRCADVDRTFAANKFACSCAYVEGAPCPHQQAIDGYKRRIGADSGAKSGADSTPSTSASAGYRKPSRHKPRRKTQVSPSHHVDCTETKSLLQSAAASTSTSQPETCQFDERLANRTERTDCVHDSSASSSTSRSSSSESCSSSSTSSSDPSSSSSNTSQEPSDGTNAANCTARLESRLRRRRGYKIMDERLRSGRTSSDEEDADSASAGSDSDVSSSDGSTSASSDDSWWRTYEREKDLLFLKQNDLMKDSGYVSTTSPNTDSTKTD